MSRTSLPILFALTSCNTQKKKELERLDQAEETVREGWRYLGTPRADRTEAQRQRFGSWHPTRTNARVDCDRARSRLGILRVVAMPERCGARAFVHLSNSDFDLQGLYVEETDRFEVLALHHLDPRRHSLVSRPLDVVESVDFDPTSLTLAVKFLANRNFEPSRWSWLHTPGERCVGSRIRDLQTSFPVLDASCVIIGQDCDRLVGDVFARCAGREPLVGRLGPG